MQFQVPQFLEVEARIIGPLTIKQFVYIAGSGGVCFASYIITKNFFLSFLISAPVVIFAMVLAFKKINNKPFSYILEAAIKFYLSEKLYLWKKVYKKNPEPTEETLPQKQSEIPTLGSGRLKELSWQLNVSKDKSMDSIREK